MAENLSTPLRARAALFWAQLTEPPVSVRGDEVRRQSRFQASLLLSTLLAVLLLALEPVFITTPHRDIQFVATLVAATVLYTVYAISRRGHYRVANVLAILYGTTAILLVAVLMGGTSGVSGLYFLLTMMIYASLFMRLRVAALILVVHAALMLLICVTGRVAVDAVFNGPFLFNLFLGSLILLTAYHSKKLQAERQEKIIESEKRDRMISGLISDYAFSFLVRADGSLELDWITEESYNRVSGYTSDDVRDGGWFAFDAPDQESIRLEWERTKKGESTDGEHRLTTKNGEKRWLHIYRHPVWNEDHTRVIRIYGVANDVTARKEAELALRQSEERYRVITELMSDFAFSYKINVDGSLSLNWLTEEPFTRITGYTAADLQNGGVFTFHPDDMPAIYAIREKTRTGESTEGEHRIITKDGSVRWVYFRRQPIWNPEENRYDMYYGIARDVTQRKQTELALRESEERHRIISQLISDYASSFRVEKDGAIVHEWGIGSITRAAGYTWNEYTAIPGFDHQNLDEDFLEYHPDDQERVRADVEKALRGERSEGEYRMFKKNGDIYWVHVYRYPVWDETEQRVVRYYSLDQDITERKQAEAALRQSEERYRMISEMMSDYAFSFEVDTDGTIHMDWVTDSISQIVGYSTTEVAAQISRNTTILYHPEDEPRVKDDLKKVLANQRVEAEYRIFAKDGGLRWIHMSRRPIWSDREQRVVRFYGVAKDITERKRSEAALRESEERYRVITELMSDYAYAFWVEPDGSLKLDWITDAALHNVLGYTADDIRKGGVFIGFSSGDRAAAESQWQRTMAGERTESEHEAITKSGDTRWIHSYRYPVWDEEQKRVTRIYGVVKDITARKAVEIALRESEERYRVISEMMSDYAYSCIVTSDGNVPFDWITGSVSRVVDYTADEMRTLKPFEYYHPDDVNLARADVAKVLNGASLTNEYRVITKNGEERWVRVYRRPVLNEAENRVGRFYGVVQDITERKQAEEALRESEERYRMISEMISDYAFSMRVEQDGSMALDWITESVTGVTGYTPDEIVSGKANFGLYHPDSELLARGDVEKVLRGIPTESEYREIAKNGNLIWTRMYRRPVWDDTQNRVVRFYGVVQDITERKQAEEQKLRLSVEQERLTMVNQFVEAFSHDVRTSLATIETSRYLIERLTADLQKVQLPTQLGRIHQAVNHLAEQLNNLHMVSSLADPNPIPCQLNRLIESLIAENSLRARQKRQLLQFEAEPDLVVISADEAKLRQAVQHLLLNALAHTDEGGHITLRTHQDDSYVAIDVQDSGEGIAPDKLSRIFEPFYKTDSSRTLEEGGMGLGLSIVNMIVQAHGGQISVRSEPGKGSMFTIVLPIRRDELAARRLA